MIIAVSFQAHLALFDENKILDMYIHLLYVNMKMTNLQNWLPTPLTNSTSDKSNSFKKSQYSFFDVYRLWFTINTTLVKYLSL